MTPPLPPTLTDDEQRPGATSLSATWQPNNEQRPDVVLCYCFYSNTMVSPSSTFVLTRSSTEYPQQPTHDNRRPRRTSHPPTNIHPPPSNANAAH
ncbi:hypothetical protein K443DRAFT_13106 [Laccaria amethystina LaAM-08-1]|uniref:Uncharacterized protein n=1 Tax=Laccaria amethystina LaAM-08-1 TaxID=1095629 RepID=A0A0C9WWC9_9AGAR|nr:hypothetical protein K443DRAFT_13106 [Laccaria amethystina LaAM-08-1]